jgi:hypothetical protein
MSSPYKIKCNKARPDPKLGEKRLAIYDNSQHFGRVAISGIESAWGADSPQALVRSRCHCTPFSMAIFALPFKITYVKGVVQGSKIVPSSKSSCGVIVSHSLLRMPLSWYSGCSSRAYAASSLQIHLLSLLRNFVRMSSFSPLKHSLIRCPRKLPYAISATINP